MKDGAISKRKIRLSNLHEIKKILRSSHLHTVCEEAKCPNVSECFTKGTATFMIMGDVCTRNCKFCNIKNGKPTNLDDSEPKRIAKTAKDMNLKYVVVTSVTRDDLSDGGAAHFVKTIDEIKKIDSSIEVLTPDFNGSRECLDTVLKARPDVFNHNIETVERLSPQIRPQAGYKRSLDVLNYVFSKGGIVKSGFMLGLGEIEEEIYNTMKDLLSSGVSILTIGQYFNPHGGSWSVKKYYDDSFFKKLEEYGLTLGFNYVFSGIYVRSSYMAEEVFDK